MLNGDVTQPTLSRWEQSEKPIPQWASDIFLGATKITLSVAELHALLDYARRTNQSFNQVLAEAIRSYLGAPSSAVPGKPTKLTSLQSTAQAQDSALVAEDPLEYPMKPEPIPIEQTKRDLS